VDEGDDRQLLHGVLYLVDVHRTLIEEMMEDIVSCQRLVPALLVAEDEVNPLVEVLGYIVAFQRLGGMGRSCDGHVMTITWSNH